MKPVVAVALIALFLASNTAVLAQDEEPNPQLVRKEPAPGGEPRREVLIFRIQCYTNVRDCYGLAYFRNNDSSRYVSYSVFWNNGDNGRSNFVLPPGGGDHSLSGVRYNDTYAAAWGNEGVPDNAQRYYIYVCCH